jgi:hypothetical protein
MFGYDLSHLKFLVKFGPNEIVLRADWNFKKD